MVVLIKARFEKDLQTLIIKVDRLAQERAELLALREQVLDAERHFRGNRCGPALFPKRQAIDSSSEVGRLTVGLR
jgi:hypothetical protein